MEYNEALVIVENNSHGILTCTRLGKDMAYPGFLHRSAGTTRLPTGNCKAGLHDHIAKTKPLIIDQLRASMREGELELNDKTTICARCSPMWSAKAAQWKRNQDASMTASCPWPGQSYP